MLDHIIEKQVGLGFLRHEARIERGLRVGAYHDPRGFQTIALLVELSFDLAGEASDLLVVHLS